ncbi:transcription factor bHLH25-like [Lactuca sativa]|uniref:transcription factor bHLH25-like n=1 Tax=Lactuca sativa TaxID=4236 RepID=UPI0022AF3259|nr:transcription factor bHLH25-like [Lactuca sativa]
MLPVDDSLGYEAVGATKIPIISRNLIQAQDHVLAERKRREKLNRNFISLSSLIPKLKKMDKESVLEDASIYIKEHQDRVKELEGLSGTKRKNVQDCVLHACKAIPLVTRMALGRNTWVTVLCRKLRDWWHWLETESYGSGTIKSFIDLPRAFNGTEH